MKLRLVLAALLLTLSACDKDEASDDQKPVLIDTVGRFEHSNVAGNLMATALKTQLGVEIAFYPSAFLAEDKFAIVEKDLTDEIIEERILPLYPTESDKDQFQVGTLRGSEIREFVLNRTTENYRLDLHTAGLEYDIRFVGGLPGIYQINLTHGIPLEDDRYYRVAISDYYYYNRATFPGYRYRNGFEQRFQREPGLFSARTTLTDYLKGFKTLPLLDEPRANIAIRNRGQIAQELKISEIQGRSHLSPYYGYRVTTRGILTASAVIENQPGMELYLQSETDDGDPLTSEAINVYLDRARADLIPGQEIVVTGIVTEIMTYQGMTRTALRELSGFEIVAQDKPLPAPIKLGEGAYKVPNHYISTYRGNLNQKPQLDLNDGIDFWEALEGMRIQVPTPTVVGFRGGKEKFDNNKSYLTVYVTPAGTNGPEDTTDFGGVMPNDITQDYNPQVIRIVDSEYAPAVTATKVFNVGDTFTQDLVGIMSYQTNVFGNGEFAFYVTGSFPALSNLKPLRDRPTAKLVATEKQLTVGLFNVENLAGNRDLRISKIAETIRVSLKCPDIVVIPEIQDFNGPDFQGGAGADITLQNLVAKLDCGAEYGYANVDPRPLQDGGEPGGNIRVAMIYNKSRVGFTPKGNAEALDDNTIEADGSLRFNPGRLFPNAPEMQRTRKPLAAEFTFQGQKVFVIGNHLNSKLSDGNRWGVVQPIPNRSEVTRSQLARMINTFVNQLSMKNPDANIIVAGDFNAYYSENSMKILAGERLTNLMTHGDLWPRNSWYTSNYDGSASAIDHMFVSQALLNKKPEFEILHINSNFMDRSSDHDPLIGRFDFSTP